MNSKVNMSNVKESEVLSLLQPDLLTVDELLEKINFRCSRIKNLNSMPKEGLVGLFRQMILPYPQRLYRTNRRGKMLTSRRANAGLESRTKNERSSFSNERLKPPPDISNSQTIRINSQREKKSDLDSIVINDRRKRDGEKPEPERRDASHRTESFSSGRNFFLKRPFGYEKSGPPPQTQKRPRTSIRWP